MLNTAIGGMTNRAKNEQMELKQGRVELLKGNSIAKIASNGLAQFLLQSTKHTHIHAHTQSAVEE